MLNSTIPLSEQQKEKLEKLQQMDLTKSSTQLLQRSNKAQRQESYKKALVELNASFEQHLAGAISIRLDLHSGQTRKLRFKKDRIRLLKQHGIDYLSIDGANTAQVLSLISQSIIHEDAVVTPDLNDAFPFWKEGYSMVQFDNTFDILAEDIQIHYQALIEHLLRV
jgi:hypothetical protein